jgi:hypothetical protein
MFNGGVKELGMIGRSAVLCVRPQNKDPKSQPPTVLRFRPGTQDHRQQGMDEVAGL